MLIDRPYKPVVLCILDGWGIGPSAQGNAPLLADTPHFDRLIADCPHATLITHGRAVGLPEGQMGNSEVGHTTIGAGRVVPMDLVRIDEAVETGHLASEAALTDFIAVIEAATGKTAIRNLMPMQPGDVPATWADASLLQSLTGHRPKTQVAEGVARFVEWYRDYYRV